MTAPRIRALIPAAGQSKRFGGTILKQYMHLQGKPVIAHSIEAVRSHPAVFGVTVALGGDDAFYDMAVRSRFPDVDTTRGGESRAHTVMNGVEHILEQDPSVEWVLVHDAARPCLPRSCLDELLTRGLACPDGALLAIPVSDTMKRAGDGQRVERTVDRASLWQAQTPQLFPARRLAEALAAALDRGETPTDESAAMESFGAHPLLVPGTPGNIKITRPEDLKMAEALLNAAPGDSIHEIENHANQGRPGF